MSLIAKLTNRTFLLRRYFIQFPYPVCSSEFKRSGMRNRQDGHDAATHEKGRSVLLSLHALVRYYRLDYQPLFGKGARAPPRRPGGNRA